MFGFWRFAAVCVGGSIDRSVGRLMWSSSHRWSDMHHSPSPKIKHTKHRREGPTPAGGRPVPRLALPDPGTPYLCFFVGGEGVWGWGWGCTVVAPRSRPRWCAPFKNPSHPQKSPAADPINTYPHPQPLTLPEYRKMDLSQLPLKEQRRYWKLLNRQARACVS